jgi:hypothetical protein
VSATTWVDPKGYLWLFGGEASVGVINGALTLSPYVGFLTLVACQDLWVFSPYLRMWAVLIPANNATPPCDAPRSRYRTAAWSFNNKHYLYGGYDRAFAYFQDLWTLSAEITLVSCPPFTERSQEQCFLCSDGKFWNGSSCAFCLDGSVGESPNGINSTQWCGCLSPLQFVAMFR